MVLSTVEAEYIVFSRAITQALWISKYLSKIGLPLTKSITIYTDNKRLITLA